MSQAKRKKKKSIAKDVLIIFLSLIMILISISAMLFVWWKTVLKNKQLFNEGSDIEQDTKLFASGDNYRKSINFLFVGLDESESLTDVMMIVNLDIEKNEMHILHIPRDSYIGLDVTNTGKINSVYSSNAYSDISGMTNVGRLIKTVNKNFQLGIDFYATITLSAFRDVVDLTGGVPIDMLWTINYDDNITLYNGTHYNLTGEQAEAMIRYRAGYNNADIGRMEARSYFMSAAFSHFKDLGITKVLKIFDSFLDENKGEFTTNMTLGEMKDYLSLASKLTSDKVFVHTIPTESVGTTEYCNPTSNWAEPQSLLTMHKQETADLLNQYFRPYTDMVDASELQIIELKNTGDSYAEEVKTFTQIANGEGSIPRNY